MENTYMVKNDPKSDLISDSKTELTEFIAEWEKRADQVQKDHAENHHKIEIIEIEPMDLPSLKVLDLKNDLLGDLCRAMQLPKSYVERSAASLLKARTEMMEKHGVEKDTTKTKTASTISGTCPGCSGELTKEDGVPIEHCPTCGTKPFERKP